MPDMEDRTSGAAVAQLRVVLAVDDFDAVVRLYRDGLGLPEIPVPAGPGGARIAIFGVGDATLEISNAAQVRYIDQVETEGQVSGPVRLAFEVGDTPAATRALLDSGGELLAPPRTTPWGSVNSRIQPPEGPQLTLFQEPPRPQTPAPGGTARE